MNRKDRIRNARQARKQGFVLLKPIDPSKIVERRYNQDLQKLINNMWKDTRLIIADAKEAQEEVGLNDSFNFTDDNFTINILGAKLNALKAKYSTITNALSTPTATKFVNESARYNQQKFNNNVNQTFGGDFTIAEIVNDQYLQPVLDAKIAENVSLIKTIPEQYFGRVEQTVYRNMTNGLKDTLFQTLMNDYGITKRRAKTIARDQTSKTNAAITEARAQNMGVESYVWETSKDERVRETHRRNDGKTFKFNDPPSATGNPSDDVNCRCVALIKIDLDWFKG